MYFRPQYPRSDGDSVQRQNHQTASAFEEPQVGLRRRKKLQPQSCRRECTVVSQAFRSLPAAAARRKGRRRRQSRDTQMQRWRRPRRGGGSANGWMEVELRIDTRKKSQRVT